MKARCNARLVGLVGLITVLAWSTSSFAQVVGDAKDVNKDGLITSNDADLVIEHLNIFGFTDVDDDAAAEFPLDDGDLEFLVSFLGPVNVLYDAASINPSDDDLARLWYRSSWLHKDVSGNGTISALDALIIINSL